MSTVFVDTGAWIALTNPTDNHHETARSYFRSLGRRDALVTSNYVLQEAVTWLTYHSRRASARRLREMVAAAESTDWLSVVWATRESDLAAWRVFAQYDDHALSFSDCSSIALCRAEGIDTVFAFDSDFAIAGLRLAPQA